MMHVKKILDDLQHMDINLRGCQYTWQRGSIAEQLDRAMTNFQWTYTFPNGTLIHLPFIPISDHRPLFFYTWQQQQQQGGNEWPQLKHERWWTSLENHHEILTSFWLFR